MLRDVADIVYATLTSLCRTDIDNTTLCFLTQIYNVVLTYLWILYSDNLLGLRL